MRKKQKPAASLKYLDSHHGTSFYKSENDVSFITYRLKQSMCKQEISDTISKYFRFEKESITRNSDKISGQVVHPPMKDNIKENEQEPVGHLFSGIPSRTLDNT